jgi:hypothetical protein
MSPLLISSIFQAVILVHDTKKHFYKKFLYEPFPVESKLADVLADHLNAGTFYLLALFLAHMLASCLS